MEKWNDRGKLIQHGREEYLATTNNWQKLHKAQVIFWSSY